MYRAVSTAYRVGTSTALAHTDHVGGSTSDEAAGRMAHELDRIIAMDPDLRWPHWVAEVVIFGRDEKRSLVTTYWRGMRSGQLSTFAPVSRTSYYVWRRESPAGE